MSRERELGPEPIVLSWWNGRGKVFGKKKQTFITEKSKYSIQFNEIWMASGIKISNIAHIDSRSNK